MGDRRVTGLRDRFAAARIARLATVDRTGAPHIVPITFACDGDRVVTAIDHKPKRSSTLKRLDNIAAEPRVSLIVDHYDENWARLWWVRADGTATVLSRGDPGHRDACRRLEARYDEYRRIPVRGQVIDVQVTRWSGWSASS